MTLATYPCRRSCSWHRTEATEELPLFRCAGCASEWRRSEPWSPIDADGTRSPDLDAEVRRRVT